MFLKVNPISPYFGHHPKPTMPKKRPKTNRESNKDFQSILVQELSKTNLRGA